MFEITDSLVDYFWPRARVGFLRAVNIWGRDLKHDIQQSHGGTWCVTNSSSAYEAPLPEMQDTHLLSILTKFVDQSSFAFGICHNGIGQCQSWEEFLRS